MLVYVVREGITQSVTLSAICHAINQEKLISARVSLPSEDLCCIVMLCLAECI